MSGDLIALGPGKVDLLESINQVGSISEAARQSNISYRRAWNMVDTMNQCCSEPLVESMTGGKGGGADGFVDQGVPGGVFADAFDFVDVGHGQWLQNHRDDQTRL